MAAKEKVSTINSNFINNVTIRSINLPPSLQLTDQPTLRYSNSAGPIFMKNGQYKMQTDKKTFFYVRNESTFDFITYLLVVSIGKCSTASEVLCGRCF